ncbi:protein NEGATIVE GRAVITROPIC RESPONSE OF ROOTS-like [Salvia miltiorrhiza]|uniref:protein NEGATIVE GRAVITROPIC RESPONSE OF ROOTS-like n=1 Tax=Salvia miltiorrhiza TaxID=226208 RepID=UPI0025ABDFB4|nr:protein NEGATIVE GRAVITROPIC RESPONSE OF ROOTS-like [Salvia miltiorrhiza]
MKFFSWMKSKMNGKDNTIKPEPELPSYHLRKEETSGCSSSLLSIGTFGNKLEDSDEKANAEEISAQEFEEELRSLLNEHASTSSEHFDLPIDKMLESFGVKEEEREVAVVQTTGKDIPSCTRKGKGSMYTKSISFLLRKAFLCGGGSILRDPFLDTSRMDKIIKAVIPKKKHPLRQKYLEKNRTTNEQERGEASNANNWVKTDSEYIVLDL